MSQEVSESHTPPPLTKTGDSTAISLSHDLAGSHGAYYHRGGFSVSFLPTPGGLLQILSCPARDQSSSASPWIRVVFLDDLFSSEENSAEAHNSCPFCLQAINSPCLTSSILSLSVQKPELPRENTLGTC